MNYLLDTHAFLWIIFDDDKLSSKVKDVVSDLESRLYVSIITYWEIALKYALGKLELEGILPAELPHIAEELSLETLNVSPQEAVTFYKLPKTHHKDPFDRMIIWQAISSNLTLLSKDRNIKEYQQFGLKFLW